MQKNKQDVMLALHNICSYGKKCVQRLEPSAKSMWESFCRLKASVRAAIIILAVTFIWIFSGLIFPHHNVAQEKLHGKQTAYRLASSIEQNFQQVLSLAAITEAEKQIVLKAEIDAQVTKLLANEGQFLKQGDPIVQLEVQNKNEALARAKAGLQQAQIEAKATKALYEKKLSSASALAASTAGLKNAEAAYKQAQMDWKHTVIRAPFDGFIDKIHVNVGDYMQTLQGNAIIGTFMSKNGMLAVAWAAERDVTSLREGKEVQVTRFNGQSLDGVIKFIARIADPKTHTFRVEVLVHNDEENPLLSGEAVAIRMPVRKIMAHKVPSSALTLDVKGGLGLKVVNNDRVVATMAVEIVGEEDGQMWLTGLPTDLNMVVLGHSYLVDGDVLPE